MKKTQIFLVLAGIVLIVGLYTLPRIVVDNSDENIVMEETDSVSATPSAEEAHEASMSPSDRGQVDNMKTALENEEDLGEFVNLADSIGKVYLSSGKLDSAAYFYGLIADRVPEPSHLEKAGNSYYEAYGFAMNPEKTAYLAEKTGEYLEQVLEKDSTRLDLKTKIAMTHVSAANPMLGITMLREILEEDPDNESALFNMGVLSMQSGQYKIAAQRFEDLVKNHPGNIEGQFYLGVSYFESKQNSKAKKQLLQVKEMTDDPQILAGIENYLDRL